MKFKRFSMVACLVLIFGSVITVHTVKNKSQPTSTAQPPEKPRPFQTNVLVYGVFTGNGQEAYNDVKSHVHTIDELSNFTYYIKKDGSVGGFTPKQTLNLANQNHIQTYACVANLTNDDFDTKTIESILLDDTLSNKLQDNLVKLAKGNNYDGINLDIEGMDHSYDGAYVSFLHGLYQKTKSAGILLSVAVNPSLGNDAYTKGIGDNVDQVILMTYDYSYPGSPPGAVAPTWWVKSVLQYETSIIPYNKVLLGINAYGYTWGSGHGKAVGLSSLDSVRKQYHAVENFDEVDDAPYLTYTKNNQKYVLYYENEKSFTDKLNLAKEYGCGGIAIWRSGLEDEALWNTVNTYTNSSRVHGKTGQE